MNQLFIPDSPNNFIYKGFSIDDVLEKIFPPKLEQIEDEINENELYFLNEQNIKENENNNDINNNLQYNNENSSFIIDDYEAFYNKFADIKENNMIPDNEFNNPCFIMNYVMEQKLIYTPIEDENIYKIENENLNCKGKSKEKILIAIKEGKNENSETKSEKYEKTENKKKKYPYLIVKKKRRKRNKVQIDISEKNFPFQKGKGIINSLKPDNESISLRLDNLNSTFIQFQEISSSNKQEYNQSNNNYKGKIKNDVKDNINKEEFKNEKMNEKNMKYNETINDINDNFNFRFKIKKYFIESNGKKKRVKKKRKFKPDDIRKKIKVRFHKTLKNILNDNLKKAGSKELFDFLPQCFIGNVSKIINAKCFELTLKELLSTNFLIELNKEDYRNSRVDNNKYKKNIRVLNYLENNPEISKRSGFDLIKDKKYKDILKIYFTSVQFENSIFQLKEEKESPEYIQEYINRAKNYVNFYSNIKIKDNEKELDNDNEDEENEEDSKDY